MPLRRTLAEILGQHADALKADIRKCVPATVTAVHPDRQTVDVQLGTQNILFDDLGDITVEDATSIADVPLGCLRGGGFFVWVPVTVGDSVLLVYSDLSADTWRSGDGSPQPPGFAGRHTADSAFALPMYAPDAKALASPQTDANKVIIGKDGGSTQIKISGSDIELGAAVTDYVALASKIDSFINLFVTAPPGAPSETGYNAFFAQFLAWAGPPGNNWIIPTVRANLVKGQ